MNNLAPAAVRNGEVGNGYSSQTATISRLEVASTFDTSLSNVVTQLKLNRHKVLNEIGEGVLAREYFEGLPRLLHVTTCQHYKTYDDE